MDSGHRVYCCYYSMVGACLYTLCSVPYPGLLPGRRKFPYYNFCDIPDFLIRFVLVFGVPCVGVGCLSKVSSLCVVNDRRFFVGTNLARWWTFYAFIRLIYWIHDHQATTHCHMCIFWPSQALEFNHLPPCSNTKYVHLLIPLYV
jgi:hypothetical protein